jgi:hypothetical protein
MRHHVGGSPIAGNAYAWTDRVLIEQKLVMVPPQAGIDAPCAQADIVLDKGGLLEIMSTREEVE